MRLVLASGSPRRAELLRSVGVEFEVAPPDIDETPRPNEPADQYVTRIAAAKCRAVSEHLTPPSREVSDTRRDGDRWTVLAADTAVVIDGVILGKPRDGDHATQMLRRLSGRTHRVLTAVCRARPDDVAAIWVTTEVTFAQLSDAAIEWYVSTGDPFDKAGGYGLQSAGAALVSGIVGSPSNVIGLPLRETLALLDHPTHSE